MLYEVITKLVSWKSIFLLILKLRVRGKYLSDRVRGWHPPLFGQPAKYPRLTRVSQYDRPCQRRLLKPRVGASESAPKNSCLCQARFRFPESPGASSAHVCRITSYNVCYTKLLRPAHQTYRIISRFSSTCGCQSSSLPTNWPNDS